VTLNLMLVAPAVLLASSCAPAPDAPVQAVQKEETVPSKSWEKLVDPDRAAKVQVVLRVRLLKREGSDKMGWDKVKLLGVIKNESRFKFAGEFEVAHYSGEPGVPDGESTIYLEPYNKTSPGLWRLLGGSGQSGASHQTQAAGSK